MAERRPGHPLAQLDVAAYHSASGSSSYSTNALITRHPFRRPKESNGAWKIVHFELPAADADRASAFWNGLFGWGLSESAMPEMDYRMAQVSDDQGVAVFPSENPGTGPIVYFDTDDIEASISADAQPRRRGRTTSCRFRATAGSLACKDTEGNAFKPCFSGGTPSAALRHRQSAGSRCSSFDRE